MAKITIKRLLGKGRKVFVAQKRAVLRGRDNGWLWMLRISIIDTSLHIQSTNQGAFEEALRLYAKSILQQENARH